MNSEQLKGNWKQVKGEVQKQWGKLTNDDLDVINGEKEKIVGKLQERYGYAKEHAEKEYDHWCSAQRV
ncbi:CsbD family protein [Paenibacillus hodogayensis]|uniref:CsbD family protein n=1 Tax=Paenibacillus hodogayensis TaxID=279208 RepID=A0ABV5W698_9BACL